MATWREFHPDWQTQLWTDENLPELTNQAIFNQTTLLAQKADILRCEILYQFGGLYVDTDFECFKPVDPLLAADAVFGDELPGRAATGLLAAVPGHPLFERLVMDLPESFPWRGDPVRETGPEFLHRTISRQLRSLSTCPFIDPSTQLQAGHYIDIGRRGTLLCLAPWTIYPYYLHQVWQPDRHPHAYAAHHWHASWRCIQK